MNEVLADLLSDNEQNVSALLEPPKVSRLIPSQPAYQLYLRRGRFLTHSNIPSHR